MFKTMLSPNNDPMKDPNFFTGIRYPVLCSPKFDGIRCLTKEGVCKSRSFIDLPNLEVQSYFKYYQGFDGELIDGEPTDFDVYNRTQSTVMSINKDASGVKLYVFDDLLLPPDTPFELRLSSVEDRLREHWSDLEDRLVFVEHTLITSYEELIAYEEEQLELGYEGIMMRDPLGRYKYGRGTFKEGLIYKLKRFQDDEGIITGFIEQTTNTNSQEKDAFGRSKRSTSKDGLIPAGTLGKFVVDFNGMIIEVGCGNFNHKQRQQIWDEREDKEKTCLGHYLKFRHFPHGAKDMPRMPRAVGFRTKMDMEEII
jgi:DNA ligase-1